MGMSLENSYYQAPDPGTEPTVPWSSSSEDEYNKVVAGYQTQLNSAQKLYQGTDSAWGKLYNQQAGFGDSQRLTQNTQSAQNLAQAQSSAMNRGLYSTSAYDSATRNAQAVNQQGQMTLQDQLYNRQNQIRQGQLGFQAQGQGVLAGISGQQNQYMGQAQMSRQAQNTTLAQQFNQNKFATQQQYGGYNYGVTSSILGVGLKGVGLGLQGSGPMANFGSTNATSEPDYGYGGQLRAAQANELNTKAANGG